MTLEQEIAFDYANGLESDNTDEDKPLISNYKLTP